MINDKYLLENFTNDLKQLEVALNNKQLSGTSETVSQYENALADFFHTKYAIAVSNGTAAIHCALTAIGVEPEDEVIVPSTAPLMTALPVLLMNANIVFCDTNNNNFCYDTADLKKCITKKTKAVITVPMWGYPYELDEMKEICINNNVALIEDAAQAHGGLVNGKYIGTNGDLGCFSTHDRKILSTGEGGFILTNSKEYYDKIDSFRQFGGMNGHDFGLNYKLSSLQAALGISRIPCIENQLKRREENAQYILNNISNDDFKEISVPTNSKPNYYSLLLLCKTSNSKLLSERLFKKGIPSDIVRYDYKPLYEYKLFNKYRKSCKNTEELINSLLTISVHPGLTRNDLDYTIQCINNL
jgi:perosamine synthetase